MVTTAATDNLAPQPNIYPGQDGPILRNKADGSLELARARLALPANPERETDHHQHSQPESKWWSQVNHEWLTDPAYRCLVPFMEFAEPVVNSKWFSVPGHEVAYFAGIWRPWHGERLSEVGHQPNGLIDLPQPSDVRTRQVQVVPGNHDINLKVSQHALAAAGSLPFSPSQVAQSAGSSRRASSPMRCASRCGP